MCEAEQCVGAGVQRFPTNGALFKNLNTSLSKLRETVFGERNQEVLIYVVASVKWNKTIQKVVQWGCAPNFQGEWITLCTCKHMMRANQSDWVGKWVAGFCSGKSGAPQGLFYLMRIGAEYNSHLDIWNALPNDVREPKSMHRSSYGDIVEPKDATEWDKPGAAFSPMNYKLPHQSHTHRESWLKDLDFSKVDQFGRSAPLLLGDPDRSFLWERPIVAYKNRLYQSAYGQSFSLGELLDDWLEELE